MAKQTKAQKAARRKFNALVSSWLDRDDFQRTPATLEQLGAAAAEIVEADRAAAAPEEKQGELFSVQDCAAHFDSASFVTGQVNFFILLE